MKRRSLMATTVITFLGCTCLLFADNKRQETQTDQKPGLKPVRPQSVLEVPHLAAEKIGGSTNAPLKPGEHENYKVVLSKEDKKRKIVVAKSTATTFYHRTADELINASDAIIIGRPTQALIDRDHYYRATRFGTSLYEGNTGDLIVERVLMQKPGQNLVASQTIRYGEPVGLRLYSDGVLYKSIIEDNYELRQHSRYLLCLRNIGDRYVCSNGNRGKFNVDGTDPFDDVDTMANSTGQTAKQQLRQEILARFSGVSYTPFPAPGFVFPALTLTSVTPTQVAAGTSTPVSLELKGSGFLPFSRVRFGNTELTQLSYGDDGFLRATVPANLLANPGVYPVTIFNPATNANNSNPVNFTVRGQSEP